VKIQERRRREAMERALKNNPQYAMEVIEGEYEDA